MMNKKLPIPFSQKQCNDVRNCVEPRLGAVTMYQVYAFEVIR